jgi:hypothetical protein
MRDLTIREIYERHRNGDANTTTDLIKAAEHFEQIEWRCIQAGPVFRLAANEAGSTARAMREFITARARC